MTRSDRMLIAVLAVTALLAWPIVATAADSVSGRAVISGPQGTTEIALATDGTYQLRGRVGDLTVRVHDGAMSVVEADCPDRVCVLTGSVSAPGAVIACVPNGVIVQVGGHSDELDARIR